MPNDLAAHQRLGSYNKKRFSVSGEADVSLPASSLSMSKLPEGLRANVRLSQFSSIQALKSCTARTLNDRLQHGTAMWYTVSVTDFISIYNSSRLLDTAEIQAHASSTLLALPDKCSPLQTAQRRAGSMYADLSNLQLH